MIEKAVIDRFEEGQAVVLVGPEERKLVLSRRALPRGAREGDWLKVELEGENLVWAVLATEETARARQRILEKLEKLRRGQHLNE